MGPVPVQQEHACIVYLWTLTDQSSGPGGKFLHAQSHSRDTAHLDPEFKILCLLLARGIPTLEILATLCADSLYRAQHSPLLLQ